jgi:hypothetical protein
MFFQPVRPTTTMAMGAFVTLTPFAMWIALHVRHLQVTWTAWMIIVLLLITGPPMFWRGWRRYHNN